MQLHHYYRSSASYRVRIALALKGLAAEQVPVHLLNNEQHAPAHDALSAAHLVPVLRDGGEPLTQSMAIIEYLDETHPEPPLLPGPPAARARIRSIAQDIACEIHPLNNLRVLRYLVRDLKVSEDDKNRWYRHWVAQGLGAVERRLAGHPATGRFCHGDTPTLADCVLVPQIHNAQRFDCDLSALPTVMRIVDACMALDAFARTQASAIGDAR